MLILKCVYQVGVLNLRLAGMFVSPTRIPLMPYM
jgi:hypothetical protein